jgi:hypothetical protein
MMAGSPRGAKESKNGPFPVCRVMCKTCPFRKNSPYAALARDLTISALTQSSRICHSTGSSAIHHHTGKPRRLCRGARNQQLQLFYRLGVIDAATDAAWNRECLARGLPIPPSTAG